MIPNSPAQLPTIPATSVAAEGELELHLLIDGIPDGVSVIDSEWKLRYINDASRQHLATLGMSPPDVLGHEIWSAIPGIAGSVVEREYRCAMETRSTRCFELYYAPLDKWFEVRCFPNKRNLVTYSRDITAQRYRERLAELRQKLSSVLSRPAPLNAALQEFSQVLVDGLEAAFARVWLLNPGTNTLELVASAGIYTHLNGPHGRVPVGKFKIGRIAESGLPHLSNDVPHDPHVSDQDWARREGMVAFAGYPLIVEGRLLGVVAMFSRHKLTSEILNDLAPLASSLAQFIERRQYETTLLAQTEALKRLNQIATTIGAQLDLDPLLQTVTDEATKLVKAQFGAFFYNTVNPTSGEAYMLYTLSGAPREAFARFGMPRATPVFAPTFKGEGVIRLDDVTKDPRYGKMGPHHGMPKGHLPVVSYLAAPVISRSGEVLGGLFFGHSEPGRFAPETEGYIQTIAAQAAVAIDNAVLYGSAQREISNRRKAEEALRSSEERFRRLYDSNLVGVAFFSTDGFIIDANDEYLRIAGYTRAEFEQLGNIDWRGLTPPEYTHLDDIALQQVMAHKASQVYEKEYLRRDGSRIPIVLGVALLEGSHDRGVAFVLDITERKRTERELAAAQERLRQHAAVLEARVAERTAKLQASVQSLERFTYSIAHDLRAPLRGMAGLSFALMKDYKAVLDPTAVDYTNRIIQSAKRMDSLIQDLLGYARLTQVEVPASELSLDEEVAAALDQLENAIASSRATVHVKSPLGTVWANATVLEQVIANLISNALKFVAPGVAPIVEISTEVQPDQVVLHVKDNGIGIAEEHFERIFKVFERLHDNKSYAGTGIGLAIVQKGVERLGGGLAVSSKVGVGSTFSVKLPRTAPVEIS
ncbi:MAG TPA: GAF domain-containing protein [Methylomirabilota bacterium]|nr:GAF domain-containing protein [Methylomirabilota bacterium]